MSYDTNRHYTYLVKSNKLRLYKILRSSGRIVDNQGRLTGGLSDDIIYPDESITNGIRVEYTAFLKPFVSTDPNVLSVDTDEDTWTNPSLTEVVKPDENSHVNLNRALSLAIVCYVKANLAERAGDIQLKEYYLKEFQKKVADNESNKNRVFMARAINTFAVK